MVVSDVVTLLHADMPSSLFVSWAEDMVLTKLKYNGNLGFDKIEIQWQFSCNVIRRGCASSGSLVCCWLVSSVRSGINLVSVQHQSKVICVGCY